MILANSQNRKFWEISHMSNSSNCLCENILVSINHSHRGSYNFIVICICCLCGRYFSPAVGMEFFLLLLYFLLVVCSCIWTEISIFCLLFLFRQLGLISGDLVSVCVLISDYEPVTHLHGDQIHKYIFRASIIASDALLDGLLHHQLNSSVNLNFKNKNLRTLICLLLNKWTVGWMSSSG